MGVSPTPDVQAFLASDGMLAALAPGGVWEDPAPDIPDLFVGIALFGSVADRCGGGSYILLCTYDLVGVAPVGDAAAIGQCRSVQERIHAIVHAQPIIMPGWQPTTPEFEGLIERTQNEAQTGKRWILRGGRYRWNLEPA